MLTVGSVVHLVVSYTDAFDKSDGDADADPTDEVMLVAEADP